LQAKNQLKNKDMDAEVKNANLKITVEETFDPEAMRLIESAINQYNMTVTGDHAYRSVNVLLRDEQGGVKGGALGGVWGGWLYLKLLWVSEEVRGQGYGSRLLALAEAEAIAAECRGIYLETYDFQAYSFYKRAGYEATGQLQDFPLGHTYYYMAKRLDAKEFQQNRE
jgi:GNAT superfamily N-acetyltransferase